jgi:hypothetical protein
LRYTHAHSGTSHNLELNRLFFAGETVKVSIFKDDMDDKTASQLEKDLIVAVKPKLNIQYKDAISKIST